MVSVVTDFFWCVISFLQTYSGAVTAIATIAISIFTYFLVRVSNRQARLTKAIIELTNKYVSTHRPILRIRRITLTDFHERIGIDEICHGDKVFIKIVVVNAGCTPAIMINSKYRIFFFQGQVPIEIPYDNPPFNLTKQATIFAEGQHGFEISADAI